MHFPVGCFKNENMSPYPNILVLRRANPPWKVRWLPPPRCYIGCLHLALTQETPETEGQKFEKLVIQWMHVSRWDYPPRPMLPQELKTADSSNLKCHSLMDRLWHLFSKAVNICFETRSFQDHYLFLREIFLKSCCKFNKTWSFQDHHLFLTKLFFAYLSGVLWVYFFFRTLFVIPP